MKLSHALAAELEELRLRHLHAGSLDVAQEILDLLVGVEEEVYNEAIQDALQAVEALLR